MQTFLIILCLVLMMVSAAAVMMIRSLLKSTICLAITSVLLAIVLFLLKAYWAGLFELSVCAGLITAVFISAISFSTRERKEKSYISDHRARFKLLPYLMVLCGIGLLALLVFSGFSLEQSPLALSAEFKQIFWNTRQVDILAQIALIVAGAFAVIVLFKERDTNDPESHPVIAGGPDTDRVAAADHHEGA